MGYELKIILKTSFPYFYVFWTDGISLYVWFVKFSFLLQFNWDNTFAIFLKTKTSCPFLVLFQFFFFCKWIQSYLFSAYWFRYIPQHWQMVLILSFSRESWDILCSFPLIQRLFNRIFFSYRSYVKGNFSYWYFILLNLSKQHIYMIVSLE